MSAARRTHRVLVFTTPTCPWCNRAKAYLRERHVPFREVDVSGTPRRPGTWSAVPGRRGCQ
jgi:hypothetical protein